MRKSNRRAFIRLAGAGVIFVSVFLWNKLTLNYIQHLAQPLKIIPLPKNKLVTFLRKYLIIKRDKTTVLSARCTHLGCTIDKLENNRLICPCHGSEFDLDGNAVKGPAFRNLKKIPSHVTADGKNIELN